MCKRVFSVGFGHGLDSSPARSWRSASHAAGLHDWMPKKWGLGLRRGRIRWIQFAQSLLPVAHTNHAQAVSDIPSTTVIDFYNVSFFLYISIILK